MHDLNADDWYATVRRAAPFAELPRDMFDAVIGMMSGEYNSENSRPSGRDWYGIGIMA